jgi:hypothetical protein
MAWLIVLIVPITSRRCELGLLLLMTDCNAFDVVHQVLRSQITKLPGPDGIGRLVLHA